MVKVDGALDKVAVSADGKGMVPLAGAGLLALCADRVGLTRALSGRWRRCAGAGGATTRAGWFVTWR
jgi:hypothetical protein